MSQERLVSGDCSQAYTAVPLTLHPKPDLLVLIKRILKSHISLVNLCIHALEKPAREARTYVGTGRTCKRLTKPTIHPVNFLAVRDVTESILRIPLDSKNVKM